MSEPRHLNRTGFFYALPFLGNAMLLTPLITFVPSFYSGDPATGGHGLPLALVGQIIFFTRLLDIVAEPVVGVLSDATRTRLGRRKPWILGGLPLLALATWMVFAPPVAVTPAYAALWIALAYLAYTVVETPYSAWGAELSKTYGGRTRIAGWKQSFGILSSLAALTLIVILQMQGRTDLSDMMFWLGAAFVAVTPILFVVCLVIVPEPPVERLEGRRINWREGLVAIAANRPFMLLLGGMAVLMAGAIIGASLHLIVMDKVFSARSWLPFILGGENIASLVAVPFWMALAKRIGKHRALAFAALWMAAWSAPIPLLGPGDAELYAACIVIRGLAGGALAFLIAAMIADVVDLDTLKTGEARNGMYFALVGTMTKLGLAVGALAGTTIPSLFGFETAGANDPQALFALLVTYAWIPMVIMALSAPFFWRYPLTEAMQKELRRQIEDRLAGASARTEA